MKATGIFELSVQSLCTCADNHKKVSFNHVWFDKVFEGALIAKSKFEVLGEAVPSPRSYGYIAIEQVMGILHGKRGSFILQHHTDQKTDRSQVLLQIVPGSGTGELIGLSGKMTVIFESGQHFYDLSYNLIAF